jgi:hypothetical protein
VKPDLAQFRPSVPRYGGSLHDRVRLTHAHSMTVGCVDQLEGVEIEAERSGKRPDSHLGADQWVL